MGGMRPMRTTQNSAPTPGMSHTHRLVSTSRSLRLPRSSLARLSALLLAATLLALALLATSVRPAAASVDDFSFESMSVDYHLSRDADGRARLDVTETLVADFPSFDQNRGLVRKIPLDYDGVSLDPTVMAVSDDAGRAVVYDTKRVGGQLEVSLGSDEFVHGRQTYVLSYAMQNTVRHFADTDTDEVLLGCQRRELAAALRRRLRDAHGRSLARLRPERPGLLLSRCTRIDRALSDRASRRRG